MPIRALGLFAIRHETIDRLEATLEAPESAL